MQNRTSKGFHTGLSGVKTPPKGGVLCMKADRVQSELHAAVCAEADDDDARNAIRMHPDSAHHNQLITKHMRAVRISETNTGTMELILRQLLINGKSCRLGIWKLQVQFQLPPPPHVEVLPTNLFLRVTG